MKLEATIYLVVGSKIYVVVTTYKFVIYSHVFAKSHDQNLLSQDYEKANRFSVKLYMLFTGIIRACIGCKGLKYNRKKEQVPRQSLI